MPSNNLHDRAWVCLLECEPAEKIRLTRYLQQDFADQNLASDETPSQPVRELLDPGRPAKPELVAPRLLTKRKLSTDFGRAALVHAIAHIEFNAINLALDAVYRFRGMPNDYYKDWLMVAADEARHFEMLDGRLHELGFVYGDFPAHDGLWQMAVKTSHSIVERMALVPRVLEARGLDVTPEILKRVRHVGDQATASILEIILAEEVAHVEAGTRWFQHVCAEHSLEPDSTFLSLLEKYDYAGIRKPLNHIARREAGFSDFELTNLENLAELAEKPSRSH